MDGLRQQSSQIKLDKIHVSGFLKRFLFEKLLIVDKIAISIGGALMPLAYSPYDLFLLPFVSYTLLIVVCRKYKAKKVLALTWLFSFTQFSWGILWVYESFHLYTEVPQFIAVILSLLFAAFISCYSAIAMWFSKIIWKNDEQMWMIAGIPISIVCMEWLRGHTFGGFPWMYVGHSQSDSWLSGYMPLIGSLSTGIIVIVCASILTLMVLGRISFTRACACLAIVFGLGNSLQFAPWTKPFGNPIKVSLLQGNVKQGEKWDANQVEIAQQWYLASTKSVSTSNLIIWPESAIANYHREVKPFLRSLSASIDKSKTDVISGMYFLSSNERNASYYNSLYTTSGERYDKRHLVPFGEYYPWSMAPDWLQTYLSFPHARVIANIASEGVLHYQGLSYGVSICYELAYTSLVFNRKDIKFLVSASNDGNFEGSNEPFQHNQIARIRALESKKFLARSSNNGISAIINPGGEMMAYSELSKTQIVSGDIQPMSGNTPYVIFGDLPLLLVGGFILFATLYRRHVVSVH